MTQIDAIEHCEFAINGQDAIDKIKKEVQNQIKETLSID